MACANSSQSFFNINPKFSRSSFIANVSTTASVVVFFIATLEEYNTIVETSAIKELLLNFGLELKKL